MKMIILCLMFLVASTATRGQKPPERGGEAMPTNPSPIDELKKIDRDLDAAYERGEASVFEKILGEQMVNVSPEGLVSKRVDVIHGVKPPKKGTTLTITATDIQAILVAESGIVTSKKTARWVFANGSTSTDEYRESNTYARKDGQWLLLASITSHAPPPPPPYSAKDVNLDLTVDESQIRGNRNASIVLIEFADYECPYCRQFANDTMKQIERDYIDNGRIGFVFRDFPIESSHPHAFGAALATQCAAEQGHLWEMNHKLLAESSALAPAELFQDAESLKLDMAKFRDCFADERTATQLRLRVREASALGIDGTPMFLVGIRKAGSKTIKGLRMIEGGFPYEVFKAALDMMIAARN